MVGNGETRTGDGDGAHCHWECRTSDAAMMWSLPGLSADFG
jgi:hypothetical protein